MTGRALAVTAATALTVTALAVTLRPLLPTSSPPGSPQASTAMPDPPGVVMVADRAARTDLRCPATSDPTGSPRPPVGCGRLQLGRHQVRCVTATHCLVDLSGELRTDNREIPVALTVTLTGTGPHWRVLEVRS